MTAQSANTIGLTLGIIGVILIFVWGPPQPSLETGISIALEAATPIDPSGRTVADHDREIAELRLRHIIFSHIGLGLIGIGFVCQLWATWIPSGAQPSRDPQAKQSPTQNTQNVTSPKAEP